MIPKQDRMKPRTIEDLERMYNFKYLKEHMVDKDDNKKIVEMVNRALGDGNNIVFTPKSEHVSDGAFINFELLRFKYLEDTYALVLTAELVESGSELTLAFDGLSLTKVS